MPESGQLLHISRQDQRSFPQSFWHQHTGHSLVEVLSVAAMVVALIALLIPVLGKSKRNAYTALCMSNLKELTQAHNAVMVRASTGDNEYTNRLTPGSNWPGVLYDIDTLEDKFYCPEAKPSDFESEPMAPLMIAMTARGNFNRVRYYQTLNADDPWVKKLSMTQWVAATGGTGKFGNADAFKQFFRHEYNGYEPDDQPDRYVLMIEDYSGIISGRWINYTDFVIFVEKDPHNPTSVVVNAQHGMLGSRDKGYLVWAENKKPVYTPNRYLTRGDNRKTSVVNAPGDYGANLNQVFNLRAVDDRILFMDFEESIATPINWEQHYGEDGKLTFVRHLNETMNIALVDGSVQSVKEEKIRLSQYSKESRYW